jgi:hypothetical protein
MGASVRYLGKFCWSGAVYLGGGWILLRKRPQMGRPRNAKAPAEQMMNRSSKLALKHKDYGMNPRPLLNTFHVRECMALKALFVQEGL